jgi:hypothetical protein
MDGFIKRAKRRVSEMRRPSKSADREDVAGTPAAAPSSSAQLGNASQHGAIRALLEQPVVDVDALRRHCWFSCPPDSRRAAWSLLLDFWPATAASRARVLQRKRAEYHDCIQRHYAPHDWGAVLDAASSTHSTPSNASVGSEELVTIRQVRKDVPRTANSIAVVSHPTIQSMLERVLFTWAVRHPASGYVQGMNDLTLPFLYVVLADYMDAEDKGNIAALLSLSAPNVVTWLSSLGDGMLRDVEADTYWLTATFISSVQDNFTYNQSGAHAMVAKLEQVLRTTDPQLTMHLGELGIHFPEFAFRWMNCFLLRELSPLQAVRLWDTYLCDLVDFAEMHIYVCTAMLRLWADTISRCHEFVSVMSFLQNLPTKDIDGRGMDELCASAFLLQQLYKPTLGGLSQPDGMGSRGSDARLSTA